MGKYHGIFGFLFILAFNLQAQIALPEFPHRIGSLEELDQVVSMVEFISPGSGQLQTRLIPRNEFRQCYQHFFHENFSTFYDSVRTASQQQVQSCAERLQEGERISIHSNYGQRCRNRPNVVYNQHQLNYTVSKTGGVMTIDHEFSYKLRCRSYCQGEYLEEMKGHVNRCRERLVGAFERYGIRLNLSMQFREFGEPLLDESGRVIGETYSYNNSDFLIEVNEDNAGGPRFDHLHMRINPQYDLDANAWVVNEDAVCHGFNLAMFARLGIPWEIPRDDSVHDCSDNQFVVIEGEIPQSMTHYYRSGGLLEEMELYPRHIRQLFKDACN